MPAAARQDAVRGGSVFYDHSACHLSGFSGTRVRLMYEKLSTAPSMRRMYHFFICFPVCAIATIRYIITGVGNRWRNGAVSY